MKDTNSLERIRSQGVSGVSVIDLLNVVVTRYERDLEPNLAISQELVKHFVGHRLLDLAPADLTEKFGLEPYEITRILAALELGRRLGSAGKGEAPVISRSREAFEQFRFLQNEKQERFCASFLNAKGEVISTKTIHIGTLTASPVGPREVFREAIRENAASIIVAHNHPSGDPTPSPEDIAVTARLTEVGQLLDIPLLDHLIIGQNPAYVSFQERGLL